MSFSKTQILCEPPQKRASGTPQGRHVRRSPLQIANAFYSTNPSRHQAQLHCARRLFLREQKSAVGRSEIAHRDARWSKLKLYTTRDSACEITNLPGHIKLVAQRQGKRASWCGKDSRTRMPPFLRQACQRHRLLVCPERE